MGNKTMTIGGDRPHGIGRVGPACKFPGSRVPFRMRVLPATGRQSAAVSQSGPPSEIS